LTNKDQLRTAILNLLRLFAFWMSLFTIQRIFFLSYYHSELKGIPFSQVLLSFFYGLSLDMSASCYLLALPALLMSIGMTVKKDKAFFIAINWINYLLIAVCLVIGFVGIALYANWGQKINSKALSFLIYPSEVGGMVFDKYNLLYFAIFWGFTLLLIYVYRKFFKPIKNISTGLIRGFTFFILFTSVLLVGARGGFQKIPVDKGRSYFSKNPVLNYASLNDFWNFFDIVLHPEIKTNPYLFTDKQTALNTIAGLYNAPDSTEYIVKTARPNIVLIIMESFSADAIACLGGEPGIAPKFDSLAKEGLLFTNYYATGFRTDQGVVALLSSFPAQPVSSIIHNFPKFEHLPNIIKTMGENGYYTSFYYGCDLGYADTRNYLKLAGINLIKEKNNIPHTRETDWGAYDEDVFKYQMIDLNKQKQPFFSAMFSLTNHEFFTGDVEKIRQGNSENDLYHNTTHYSDLCLYNYIQLAKKQKYWDNTLYIIVADHAHKHPLERKYNEVARHHIPLLICGGALKEEYKGKVFAKTGSQLDVSAIILGQLNIKNSGFKWSKNILNENIKGFAYYTFDNGFGFVTDSSEVVYDNTMHTIISSRSKFPGAYVNRSLSRGKAMLQLVFQEYIDL
jgi:phosphoglycerol transferase MdoB-like AlkP superfamily enzyme